MVEHRVDTACSLVMISPELNREKKEIGRDRIRIIAALST